MTASTVAIGVVALEMPASADAIRVSDHTKQVNGSAARKKPHTSRCAHTRPPRGSRPRVTTSSPTRVAAASTIRTVTIWKAVQPRRATIMTRKLEPQTRASVTNFACQGTRRSVTPAPAR